MILKKIMRMLAGILGGFTLVVVGTYLSTFILGPKTKRKVCVQAILRVTSGDGGRHVRYEVHESGSKEVLHLQAGIGIGKDIRGALGGLQLGNCCEVGIRSTSITDHIVGTDNCYSRTR